MLALFVYGIQLMAFIGCLVLGYVDKPALVSIVACAALFQLGYFFARAGQITGVYYREGFLRGTLFIMVNFVFHVFVVAAAFYVGRGIAALIS